MYITAQGCRLRNDLYCVEWDVKLYYTIPYLGRAYSLQRWEGVRSPIIKNPTTPRPFAPGLAICPPLAKNLAGDYSHFQQKLMPALHNNDITVT